MVHQHHRHRHNGRDLKDFLSNLGDAIGLNEETPVRRAQSTEIVYLTLEPTFTGEIAGYSTAKPGDPVPTILLDHSTTTTTTDETKKPSPTTTEHKPTTTTKEKPTETSDISDLPASIVPSSSLDPTNTEVLLASQTTEFTTPTYSPSATPTQTSIPESSDGGGGMSAGAKAGLAIGIIAIVAAALSLIFFCFRRRKKAQESERIDDEKFNAASPAFVAAGAPGSMRSVKTLSTAPRVDFRPTTAFFMPNRASHMSTANATANSNASGNVSVNSGLGIQLTPQSQGPNQGSWEQPTADQQNRANPFGNHAESIDPVNAAGPSVVDGVSAAGVVMAAGAGAGAASARSANGPVRSTSRGAQNKYMGNANKNVQSPFTDAASTDGNGTQNASPQPNNAAVIPLPLAGVAEESSAISSASTTSLVSVATSTGAAGTSQLFRVHLDFAPSMPDELRVKAGEIVRLIKEFDDGWCMCARDDPPGEGVLPRTCISNSPIAARRNSPPARSTPGPFQNGQRRQSPPGPPFHNGPPKNPNGRNSPGPGRGPQYRPQQGRPQQGHPPQGYPQPGRPQQGRPMSPAMSNNGRNSPGPGYGPGPGPQYRPQQQQQQQQQPRPMSPAMSQANNVLRNNNNNGQPMTASPSTPLISITSSESDSSIATDAASVPLPESPALSQTSQIPEVTVTAPVERKPVGRKPVPGQAM